MKRTKSSHSLMTSKSLADARDLSCGDFTDLGRKENILSKRRDSGEKLKKSVLDKREKKKSISPKRDDRPLKPKKKLIDFDKIHQKAFSKLPDLDVYLKKKIKGTNKSAGPSLNNTPVPTEKTSSKDKENKNIDKENIKDNGKQTISKTTEKETKIITRGRSFSVVATPMKSTVKNVPAVNASSPFISSGQTFIVKEDVKETVTVTKKTEKVTQDTPAVSVGRQRSQSVNYGSKSFISQIPVPTKSTQTNKVAVKKVEKTVAERTVVEKTKAEKTAMEKTKAEKTKKEKAKKEEKEKEEKEKAEASKATTASKRRSMNVTLSSSNLNSTLMRSTLSSTMRSRGKYAEEKTEKMSLSGTLKRTSPDQLRKTSEIKLPKMTSWKN
ncbi:axoneme-associated protein [Planoprotostelium fungivorum]|uniref:Axoneme-associated protein n=1 Tax=Planoprotostelium fungivorum TaxID=1890364 RepID=A0A2P6MPE5_9EUKA|nr:axoneme-associated protein [Planoprotostelium fungivorum]